MSSQLPLSPLKVDGPVLEFSTELLGQPQKHRQWGDLAKFFLLNSVASLLIFLTEGGIP